MLNGNEHNGEREFTSIWMPGTLLQRFFMLDKFILKIKIHLMTTSRFHGICGIKVMMNAFPATLYSKT